MYSTRIPETLRSGNPTRQLQPGLDVPSWFWEGLKGLDKDFYLVWHPYRLQWTDIINKYEGPLDDPRLVIGQDMRYGAEELWGWVLTDNTGRPIPENRWHLWRLCGDRGWAHILPVKETAAEHLRYYLDRLHLRVQIGTRYGILGWNKFQDEENEMMRLNELQDKEDLYMDAMKENKGFLRKVMENMERGITAPTNPTRDVIRSYASQKNHSRIEMPLTEREAGIVTPWGD